MNDRNSVGVGKELETKGFATDLPVQAINGRIEPDSMVENSKTSTTYCSVRLSLTCTHHLACVKGSETGRVLGLQAGKPLTVAGGVALFRPATGLTAKFCLGTLLVSSDVSLRWCGLPRKKVVLHLGTKVWIEQNLWQVRARPSRVQWSIPGFDNQGQAKSFNRKWLFFLPVVFLGFTLFRWIDLSVLWLLGLTWLVLLGLFALCVHFVKRMKNQDAAALALSLRVAQSSKEFSEPNTQTPTEMLQTHALPVRLQPGKRAKTAIQKGEVIGIAGASAKNQAIWLGGQLAATLGAKIVLRDSSVAKGDGNSRTEISFGAKHLPHTILLQSAVDNHSSNLPEHETNSPPNMTNTEQNTDTGFGVVTQNFSPSLSLDEGKPPWATILWARQLSNLPESCTLVLGSETVELAQDWLSASAITSVESVLPEKLTLDELLFAPTIHNLQQSWQTPKLQVLLGTAAKGELVSVDLLKNGPHSLLVGCTGSGKTEALLTWIFSICAVNPPWRLRLVLLDYKGGAGLSIPAQLPHVDYFCTDLNSADTAWVLTSLQRVLQQRKHQLNAAGFRDIAQWEAAGGAPPRILVVADEFRFLAEKHPHYLQHLLLLATQGRSLGMYLVLATQRLAGAINSDMRAVIDNRVALRCLEQGDSIDAIGSPNAAFLPYIPGRAILGEQTFQIALAENPDQWVQTIQAASQLNDSPNKSAANFSDNSFDGSSNSYLNSSPNGPSNSSFNSSLSSSSNDPFNNYVGGSTNDSSTQLRDSNLHHLQPRKQQYKKHGYADFVRSGQQIDKDSEKRSITHVANQLSKCYIRLENIAPSTTERNRQQDSSTQTKSWRVLPTPLPDRLNTAVSPYPSSGPTAVFEQQETGDIIPWHYAGQSLLLTAPSSSGLRDCIDLAVMLATRLKQICVKSNLNQLPKRVQARIQTRHKPIFWLENQSLTTRIFVLQQLLTRAEKGNTDFTLVLVHPNQFFAQLETKIGSTALQQLTHRIQQIFTKNSSQLLAPSLTQQHSTQSSPKHRAQYRARRNTAPTLIAIDQKPVPHLEWLSATLLRIPPGTCEQNLTWLTRFGLSPLRLSQTNRADLFAVNPAWEHTSPQRFAALNLLLSNKTEASANAHNSPLLPMQFCALSEQQKPQAYRQALAKCSDIDFPAGTYPYPAKACLQTIAQEKIVFKADTAMTIVAPHPELLENALGLKSSSTQTPDTANSNSTNSYPVTSTDTSRDNESKNSKTSKNEASNAQANQTNKIQVKLLHPHEWMRLTPTSTDTVLAIEPRTELVRLLTTASFQGNLEALAATPFQRATGLYLTEGRLRLVRIVTENNCISKEKRTNHRSDKQTESSHLQTLAEVACMTNN